MDLIETYDQVFSILFILCLGFVLTEIVRKKFGLKFKISHILYIWHSLFSLVYALYAQTHTADANGYYYRGLSGDVSFALGTPFVDYFASFFITTFHLSYLGTFFLFHIFGFLGLLAFYASINYSVQNSSIFVKRLMLITIFLPSISFWSSAIGKDSLAFMSVGLALWAVLNLRKRILLMIFAILVMVMIRPHIAGLFIIASSLTFIFDKKSSLFSRIVMTIISAIVASILIPFALKYAGVDYSQESNIINYIEHRQTLNMEGGSSLDISSMPLPVQLFTYAFRPLPYEAHSVTALVSSLDNMFILFLFILFLKSFFKKKKKKKKIKNEYNMSFIMIFTIISWLILAITTANLGIAVRQKWMFLPFLIFIFFHYIKRDNRHNKKII